MVRFSSIFIITVSLALASCDATIHFYPEADVEPTSNIRLNVDWSDYGKTVPTGMTVVCHHTVTGEKRHTIDNNIAYVSPRLAEGRHWATVFNLTEDEYNYIGFRGLDAVETVEAFAPQQEGPSWCETRTDAGSYVAWPPEWLATDTIMTDHVRYTDSGTKVIGTLHPKNIIYTLHVTIHTENIGNLRSARGSISGMASGRKLAADLPNDNSVTVAHPIESDEWARSRTSSDPDIGLVQADIRCFGLPGNHGASPSENILEFQALLADGKTVLRYNIPVGHLITEIDPPPGRRGDNLDLWLNLRLDPPLPPGGNSDLGLDVWVEDWEDTPDVNIGLHSKKQ
ncbi:MAG: DUF5119 domain-containing protein [Muribaculaceae bacterium]|nr:DUF5119 domain-containing protein [Muribaculaceae bacterium]